MPTIPPCAGIFLPKFWSKDSMSSIRTPLTVSPHEYFGDITGRPLDYGTIYFGEPDKDPEFYPIDVYSDEALTQPIPQPIRTKGGFINVNGDIIEIFGRPAIYSVKVLDQYGRKIFYKGKAMRNNVNDDIIAEIDAAIQQSKDDGVEYAKKAVREAINKEAIEGGEQVDTFVVVTAKFEGAIARTQAAKNMDTLSLREFVADSNDAKQGFKNANREATALGKAIYIPAGIYDFGDNEQVTATTSVIADGACIKGTLNVKGNNLIVSGLEIDGGITAYDPTLNITKGRLFMQGNNNLIFNCYVHNTHGVGAIACYGGNDNKVIACRISDAFGVHGDGIYFGRSTNNFAAFNTIKRVQRCGIVSDTDSKALGIISHNSMFVNNIIDNTGGVDAVNGELGAGIWCENTANAIVTSNIIRNFTRRGIVINPNTQINTEKYLDGTYSYHIDNNNIYSSSAQCWGIALAGVEDASIVTISNNALRGTFQYGLDLGGNKNIQVSSTNFFGNFSRKIRINALDKTSGKATNVTLDTLSKDLLKYDAATSDPIKADIELVGNGYLNLTIRNLVGVWEIKQPTSDVEGVLKIANTDLVFSEVQNAVSNNVVFLSNFRKTKISNSMILFRHYSVRSLGDLELVDCKLTSLSSEGTKITSAYASKNTKLHNVDCYKVRFNISQNSDNAIFSVLSSSFREYGEYAIAPSTGLSSANWSLRVYETDFDNSDTTKAPFKVIGNPSKGDNRFRNIFYNSDNLFDTSFTNKTVTKFGLVKVGTDVPLNSTPTV